MIIALLVLILLAILFPGLLRAAFIVIALVVLFAIGSAHRASAAELPIINVDATCSWRFEDNRYAYNRCIDIEQTTYDLLRGLWPDLSPDVQSQAADMAVRLEGEHNPYVYQNAYDLVLLLLDQQQIRDQMTAPKRQFRP